MGKYGIKKHDELIFMGKKCFRAAWLTRYLGG
jgi:hypothetical protein